MIAIITSTLQPTKIYSRFSNNERYQQTVTTIHELLHHGFEEIILLDNSAEPVDTEKLKTDSYSSLKVYTTPAYSFQNKGLNEALLILNNIYQLPDSTPIFKISARYYPNKNFKKSDFESIDCFDFIGIGENFDKRTSSFSTRAYAVKNKTILEKTLVTAIEEMLSYSKGIYGFSSAFKFIKSKLQPGLGSIFQLSLEQSFARILKHQNKYLLLDKINIDGIIAGFENEHIISE